MIIQQPIPHILTDISLNRNLLSPSRRLRHTTPRRKLFPKLLRDLLQLQPKRLQSADLSNILPLIPLHALDDDLTRGALLALTGFLGLGLGRLLLCVLLGAFLGVDGQGREVLGKGFVAVELGVDVRLVLCEPLLAFLRRTAVFTILEHGSVSPTCWKDCALHGRSWVWVGAVPTSGGREQTPQ